MKLINRINYHAMRILLKLYTGVGARKFKSEMVEIDSKHDVAIIISTFEKRFNVFALPLISAIREISQVPITLVINGNFGTERNSEEYQNFILKTQVFKSINIVTFSSFRGWSSLLNSGISHADAKVSIVMNDDIYLNPELFKNELGMIITAARQFDLILLNNSWSHFAITDHCLETVGFFDENFLGIGEEDGDYAARFKQRFKKEVPIHVVNSMVNFVDKSRDTSVGVINGKYSLFNSVYLEKKISGDKLLDLSTNQSKILGCIHSSYRWRNTLYSTLALQSTEEVKMMINKNWHLVGKTRIEEVE